MHEEKRAEARGHARLGAWLLSLLLGVGLVAGPAAADQAPDDFEATLPQTLAFAASRLRATAESLTPTAFPQETRPDGTWVTTNATPFTSGFFSGSLWYMYQYTGEAYWRSQAERWQAGVEGQKTRTDDHDLGFMLFSSFGNAYRLTGEESFRQVVLTAADSLSQRYHPGLGFIRSRGDIADETDLDLIIDTMMNLELLFWAGRNGGSPQLREMATRHALNTMASHVRPDGSTFQVVRYDPRTGALKEQGKEQGCRYETVWSRGQAWAIYGFTVAWRETGDRRFLETARRTADFYLTHAPGDLVAYWDFFAPGVPDAPRDSSAAAVTASALVELSQLEQDSAHAARYWAAARRILASLSSAAYLSRGTPFQSILRHGTAFKPRGRADIGLVYADYYFLEALLRYAAATPPPGTWPPARRPPELIATRSPMPDAPVVGVEETVRVLFSEDVRGVDAYSFRLLRGRVPVEALVTYDAATRLATLAPAGPLHPSTRYTVLLTPRIRGLDGKPLAPQRWRFTTEPPPLSDPRVRLFDFERGTLEDWDEVLGPVRLEGAGALRGALSARIPGVAPAWLQAYFPPAGELSTSLLLRPNAAPGAAARLLSWADGGALGPHLLLLPNRGLQLRNGETNVGTRSNFMERGAEYLITLRQRRSEGPFSVVEFWQSGPGSSFECPFASSRVRQVSPTVHQLRLGASEVPLDVTLDDVRLETAR